MRRAQPLSLATVLLGGLSTPALAGDVAAASLAPLAMRAGLSLLAVLAAIGGLAFLVRRLNPAAAGRTPGRRLASLARLDLGSRREIRLVEAEGRRLLVGVGPDRVQLLAELSGEASADDQTDRPPLRVLRELTTSS